MWIRGKFWAVGRTILSVTQLANGQDCPFYSRTNSTLLAGSSEVSTQELANDFAAVDELDGPADAAHVFVVGVDAERRVDRAEQVAHGDGAIR